jgi:hypothetical protein
MQDESRKSVLKLLKRIFSLPDIKEEYFSPALRVPEVLQEVSDARKQLINKYGKLLSLTDLPEGPVANFERAQVPIHVAMDASGLIGGLYFKTPRFPALIDTRIVHELQTLPGRASILIERNGREWLSLRSADVLAVGSSFKLFVLAMVLIDVQSGRRKWDDIVRSSKETVSFGGIFERWPQATSYTLETLCIAMIAASDNSATDLLIDVVGRDRLETTEVNKPFLKTREMYLLKFGSARGRAREYEESSCSHRVEILREIGKLEIGGSPTGFEIAPRIEWFFTNKDLVPSCVN